MPDPKQTQLRRHRLRLGRLSFMTVELTIEIRDGTRSFINFVSCTSTERVFVSYCVQVRTESVVRVGQVA